MRLNIMFSGLVLLGLVGGLLVSSGCAPGKMGKEQIVSTYIDEENLQSITGNKLINCSNIRTTLSFLDSSTQHLASSIVKKGSNCMIYFDPSEFSMSDLKIRGYTLYIYQNDGCVAAFYKSPHAKPFFSSAC